MNNIFLTGEKRVGKSTIINKTIKDLNINPSGFKTLPYYKNGTMVGYYMKSLLDSDTCNQNIVSIKKGTKYIPLTETFENEGVKLLKDSLECEEKVILMDELGFFEREAYLFQTTVFNCLDSSKVVIGVLKKKHVLFLEEIKNRKDIVIIDVDIYNREEIYQKFKNMVKSAIDKTLLI